MALQYHSPYTMIGTWMDAKELDADVERLQQDMSNDCLHNDLKVEVVDGALGCLFLAPAEVGACVVGIFTFRGPEATLHV